MGYRAHAASSYTKSTQTSPCRALEPRHIASANENEEKEGKVKEVKEKKGREKKEKRRRRGVITSKHNCGLRVSRGYK